jgi:hypothetical protein
VDSIPPLKRCSKCKQEFPATTENFSRNKATRDGLQHYCKRCFSESQKAYRQQPQQQERIRRYMSDYKAKPENKAKAKQLIKERQSTPEFKAHRKYRRSKLENKTKELAYAHDRWLRIKNDPNHKEKRRESSNRTYANPLKREKRLVRTRLWHENHKHDPSYKAKVKVVTIRYRARKRQLQDTLTLVQWSRAVSYFDSCCAICGRALNGLFHTAAADHWLPLSSADCPGTTASNIVPLCHGVDGCNNSKSNRDPVEWLEWKFGERKAKRILKRIEAYFEWVRQQDQ